MVFCPKRVFWGFEASQTRSENVRETSGTGTGVSGVAFPRYRIWCRHAFLGEMTPLRGLQNMAHFNNCALCLGSTNGLRLGKRNIRSQVGTVWPLANWQDGRAEGASGLVAKWHRARLAGAPGFEPPDVQFRLCLLRVMAVRLRLETRMFFESG